MHIQGIALRRRQVVQGRVVVFGCWKRVARWTESRRKFGAALPSGVVLEVLTFDPNELGVVSIARCAPPE
jgi:hypothetical protein